MTLRRRVNVMSTARRRTLEAAVLALLAGLASCENAPPPPFVPVASMKQLMNEVIEPAADTYWDAVGSVSDRHGITEHAPKSDEEWAVVRNSAMVIAESGNLLMIAPRATDRGDWMKFAREMVAAGVKARAAAESRDTKRIFDVGEEVYQTCVNCHAKYIVATSSPAK